MNDKPVMILDPSAARGIVIAFILSISIWSVVILIGYSVHKLFS